MAFPFKQYLNVSIMFIKPILVLSSGGAYHFYGSSIDSVPKDFPVYLNIIWAKAITACYPFQLQVIVWKCCSWAWRHAGHYRTLCPVMISDSWSHDICETWIKIREVCTLPASLSHSGPPEYSSKTGSRWLKAGLNAVDDLGIFGAWPSPGHSTVLCFVTIMANGCKWSLPCSTLGKSLNVWIGMFLVHRGFGTCQVPSPGLASLSSCCLGCDYSHMQTTSGSHRWKVGVGRGPMRDELPWKGHDKPPDQGHYSYPTHPKPPR